MNDQAMSVVRAIKELGKELEQEESVRGELYFTLEPEANQYCVSNPNAFFLGVIFDQGVQAERAWAAPYHLFTRLGHLDPKQISEMSLETLSSVFATKPALHRYVINMARYIQDSCRLLSVKYSGNASNIWNDSPTAKELENRLLEFKGIGQKKAAMAVGILARAFRVPVREVSGIDVAYDVHVRRVFIRTRLSGEDNMNAIIQAARLYNPDFPGELDYPAWYIGRTWCHSRKPNCVECPLANVCPKYLSNNAPLEQLEIPF